LVEPVIVVHDIVTLVGCTLDDDNVTYVIGGVSAVTEKLVDAAPYPTPFIALTLNF
jgi:hypothetical protein